VSLHPQAAIDDELELDLDELLELDDELELDLDELLDDELDLLDELDELELLDELLLHELLDELLERDELEDESSPNNISKSDPESLNIILNIAIH
jgi:pilus assembly protein FimV